jgi:hypothetical protein
MRHIHNGPYRWAVEFAATMDDVPSLRQMRRFALEHVAEFRRIRADPKSCIGREGRREWDLAMGDLLIDNLLAVRMIEARAAALGVQL